MHIRNVRFAAGEGPCPPPPDLPGPSTDFTRGGPPSRLDRHDAKHHAFSGSFGSG